MTNILIVSDTHRKLDNLKKVLERQKKLDYLLHLGDIEGQLGQVKKMAGCPVICVRGNCDYDIRLPLDYDLLLPGHHIFMTHGHLQGVGFSADTLLREAKRREADIALFGHTHVPMIKEADGVTLLNPGSISLPRQEDRRCSYALLEIDDEDAPHFTLCRV